jgi:hypothetical protein
MGWVVISVVFIKPYFYVTIAVEADHGLADLEQANFAIAVIESSEALAEEVERLLQAKVVKVGRSDGHALDHDLEDVPASAQVGGMVLHVLHCVSLDQSVVLHSSVVIDIVFLEEIGLGLDADMVRLCLLVTISIPVDLCSLVVGANVLPLLLDVLQHLHGSRPVAAHYNHSIQTIVRTVFTK